MDAEGVDEVVVGLDVDEGDVERRDVGLVRVEDLKILFTAAQGCQTKGKSKDNLWKIGKESSGLAYI